jgi:sugar phosphate isomerase/epimerase
MNNNNNDFQLKSRRDFLFTGSLMTLGILFSRNSVWGNSFKEYFNSKPNSKFHGVQIGVITYSYRSMPGRINQLLQYCIDSNISAIELMGDAVEEFAGKPINTINTNNAQLTREQRAQMMAPYLKQVADWRANVSMDKFKQVRKMFNKAGIEIYAFKPDALGAKNTDEEIDYALNAAKTLGATSVTVELPNDIAQSKRLGEFGEKHKIFIGYHAHLQATDTAWDVALSQSSFNSINLDCGHYIAAGGNNTRESLLAFIEAKHDRITSMHIKDRRNKINGSKNVVWGEGDTPIKEILTLLKNKKYKIPATIELEYDIPSGSDAVQETKKCVEYAKKILDA